MTAYDQRGSNLNRYIILSVLIHLILFLPLLMIHPERGGDTSVIDVDIIAFPDIAERPYMRPQEPEEVESLSHAMRDVKPVPHDEDLKPKAIEGDEDSQPNEASLDLRPGAQARQQQQIPGMSSDTAELSGPPASSSKDEVPDFIPLMRDSLFDRDTIEKFANKSSPRESKSSFEAPGFRNRGYLRLLKEKIERIWQYPQEMARRGIAGDLYITFVIKRDGSLGDVRLVRTSGYSALDEAAVKALRDAEPFWPLPDSWEAEDFEINGHFIYMTGRTYIL